MPWLQISVEAERDKVESISEAFDALGALSVTVLDAGDEPLLEPAPGETPLWSSARLAALFDDSIDVTAVEQQLQDLLPAATISFHSEILEDRDWSSTWRDSFGREPAQPAVRPRTFQHLPAARPAITVAAPLASQTRVVLII